MKNDKIIESWNKILPDEAADERMRSKIMEYQRSHTRKEKVILMKKTIKIMIPIAACLALACVTTVHFVKSNSENYVTSTLSGDNYVATTPGIADAALMIFVNDVLYKQPTIETSYDELKDDFVYLGVVESDITHLQVANNDGIPKENFQANHSVVGSAIYQYNDNIVVEINGKYWLYENTNSSANGQQESLSEEEKKLLDPTYGIE